MTATRPRPTAPSRGSNDFLHNRFCNGYICLFCVTGPLLLVAYSIVHLIMANRR
jgi:hypothetical protein